MSTSRGASNPLSDEIMAQLGEAIPGVDGSAVPPSLRKAIDYALQELVKAAKPATRRSPAEPADPVKFVVEKLRTFAQQERDRVSADEMAKIRKRRGRGGRGGRGGRRGSVVCSSAAKVPDGWKPTPVPKSDETRQQLHELAAKSILLHGANQFTIKTVVDCMFEREFEANSVIIQEGAPGDNFYLCTKGWTEVYKLMDVEAKSEGKLSDSMEAEAGGKTAKINKMVARLEVGATFGELALMYNAPRSATVKAGADGATCWAIDRLTFRSVVRNAVESRREAYKDALSSVPILSPLSAYEHTKLADCVEEENLEPDVVILREGDQGDFFYIVLEGEVMVTKMIYDTTSGIEKPTEVCARLQRGSYFGEIALLMDVPRQATVTTTKKTRLARIDRGVFKRVLGNLGSILKRNMELYTKYEEQIDPKAFAKKKSGGRRRRRSVVCSSSKVDSNWKPVIIPKADAQLAEIVQVISKNILFQSMTGAERRMLANVMSEKRFEAGSVIIKQGDDGDNFYILSSGSIPITKEGVEGTVYTCKPGDAFGELALLYDAPRNATCVAGPEGAVCWALDRDSFKHMLRKATLEKRQRHEAFLKDVEILKPLSDYERGRLCDALKVKEVQAEEIIVTQGDQGDHFYLIESGEFKVTVNGISEEVCDRLSRGAYFGEIALLTSKPRAATVTACQPGTLLSVHRDAFSKLLGSLNEILGRNMELYRMYSAKAAQ